MKLSSNSLVFIMIIVLKMCLTFEPGKCERREPVAATNNDTASSRNANSNMARGEIRNKVIGGGRFVNIKQNRKCLDNFIGLKRHQFNQKYYYICQKNNIILVKCDEPKNFCKIYNKCMTPKNQTDSDPTECYMSGTFSVPRDPRYYYTCRFLNHKFIKKVYECPENKIFNAMAKKCVEPHQPSRADKCKCSLKSSNNRILNPTHEVSAIIKKKRSDMFKSLLSRKFAQQDNTKPKEAVVISTGKNRGHNVRNEESDISDNYLYDSNDYNSNEDYDIYNQIYNECRDSMSGLYDKNQNVKNAFDDDNAIVEETIPFQDNGTYNDGRISLDDTSNKGDSSGNDDGIEIKYTNSVRGNSNGGNKCDEVISIDNSERNDDNDSSNHDNKFNSNSRPMQNIVNEDSIGQKIDSDRNNDTITTIMKNETNDDTIVTSQIVTETEKNDTKSQSQTTIDDINNNIDARAENPDEHVIDNYNSNIAEINAKTNSQIRQTEEQSQTKNNHTSNKISSDAKIHTASEDETGNSTKEGNNNKNESSYGDNSSDNITNDRRHSHITKNGENDNETKTKTGDHVFQTDEISNENDMKEDGLTTEDYNVNNNNDIEATQSNDSITELDDPKTTENTNRSKIVSDPNNTANATDIIANEITTQSPNNDKNFTTLSDDEIYDVDYETDNNTNEVMMAEIINSENYETTNDDQTSMGSENDKNKKYKSDNIDVFRNDNNTGTGGKIELDHRNEVKNGSTKAEVHERSNDDVKQLNNERNPFDQIKSNINDDQITTTNFPNINENKTNTGNEEATVTDLTITDATEHEKIERDKSDYNTTHDLSADVSDKEIKLGGELHNNDSDPQTWANNNGSTVTHSPDLKSTNDDNIGNTQDNNVKDADSGSENNNIFFNDGTKGNNGAEFNIESNNVNGITEKDVLNKTNLELNENKDSNSDNFLSIHQSETNINNMTYDNTDTDVTNAPDIRNITVSEMYDSEQQTMEYNESTTSQIPEFKFTPDSNLDVESDNAGNSKISNIDDSVNMFETTIATTNEDETTNHTSDDIYLEDNIDGTNAGNETDEMLDKETDDVAEIFKGNESSKTVDGLNKNIGIDRPNDETNNNTDEHNSNHSHNKDIVETRPNGETTSDDSTNVNKEAGIDKLVEADDYDKNSEVTKESEAEATEAPNVVDNSTIIHTTTANENETVTISDYDMTTDSDYQVDEYDNSDLDTEYLAQQAEQNSTGSVSNKRKQPRGDGAAKNKLIKRVLIKLI